MDRVADLLNEHVTFRLTSIDRIGIHGYIEGLAYEGGVLRFLLNRGYPLPAPAGLTHNHRRLAPCGNRIDKMLSMPRRCRL